MQLEPGTWSCWPAPPPLRSKRMCVFASILKWTIGFLVLLMFGSVLLSMHHSARFLNFLLVWTVIVVYTTSSDGSGICILHRRVPWLSWSAVRIDGTDHTALGVSNVEHLYRWGVTASLKCFGSVCTDI